MGKSPLNMALHGLLLGLLLLSTTQAQPARLAGQSRGWEGLSISHAPREKPSHRILPHPSGRPASSRGNGAMSGHQVLGSQKLNALRGDGSLRLNGENYRVEAGSNKIVCFGPVAVYDTDGAITVFAPNADMSVVHHMILVGSDDAHGSCHKHHGIVWSWARTGQDRDHPKVLELPAGKGFNLGKSHGRTHLHLEIHYVNRGEEDVYDSSGAILTLDTSRVEVNLSVQILYRVGIAIPPGQRLYTVCDAFQVAEPYASRRRHGDVTTPVEFVAHRVHAHAAGVRIETHHYRNGIKLGVIASRSPQDAQLYYLLDYPHTIEPGDYLILYCFYNTEGRDFTTYMGGDDLREEMCNHYLMYTGNMRVQSLYNKIAARLLPGNPDYPDDLDEFAKEFEREGCLK
mmetsp:Transcript_6724/g.24894  ORF Transcript_6724/g.24894 Transcript_6724/m.24894 type:complete len:400 (+) Transcript_6724:94-1293(+)